MSSNEHEMEKQIEQIIAKYLPGLESDQVKRLLGGAEVGSEVKQCGSWETWLEQRGNFGTVMLDHTDYVTALTHSLRIAPNLAATDYGSSRQRDLGQLWTDVARGFLGEIGLARFIKERFGIELLLDYTLGPIENYLPSDIKGIRLETGEEVLPKIQVSFKTTKFNGIWLDIPGAQINRSDVFVLVKLGISRDHFIAFLKWISFIRDKLLPHAIEAGTIGEEEAKKLWASLPDFKKIPCYIAGFLDKEIIKAPPAPDFRPMHNRSGALKGYHMRKYVGWVKGGEPVTVPSNTKGQNWEFEAIGSFSKEDHFVATSGCLKYSKADWKAVLHEVIGV